MGFCRGRPARALAYAADVAEYPELPANLLSAKAPEHSKSIAEVVMRARHKSSFIVSQFGLAFRLL
jgi:hypothetical protein